MSEGNTGVIVWCDVPVKNLDRAIRFYSKTLALEVEKVEAGPDMKIGIFPHTHSVGGCLYESDEVTPSMNGPLVYFNAEGRLEQAEREAVEYGGKVLEARHAIGPHGFRSLLVDSEGNRIALHSQK